MTTGSQMHAWRTTGDGRIELGELPVPTPGEGEVLVHTEVCGVCRTDLHVVRGDLTRHRPRVVPGHELVGVVVVAEGDTGDVRVGDRVGVPWLRSTCGTCHWCSSGRENLCERSRYTGWDADGGYAEYAAAPAAFTYAIPDGLEPLQAAPLLCAGIIGYRALQRACVPPGGRLGLYGFGASAHLTAQIALAQGLEVHVVTRGADARELALELGASTASRTGDELPPLDSAIVFAPVGEVARDALAALGPSGTVALAGIYLTDIPPLDYERHLFHEKTLTSVTSNTRTDGAELFRLAGRLRLHATTTAYPFEEAPRALDDLEADRVHGVAVLDLR
jgi:propanol-preferring alcohol dehydrogenase